jgi:hypothetical protein
MRYYFKPCKIDRHTGNLWSDAARKHSLYSIFYKRYVYVYCRLSIPPQTQDTKQRLGFPLEPSLEHFLKRALIKLSRTSGLYPECMTLKGTKLVGKTALAAGSYGDIWKGLLGGQEICIKVLKVFQRSDKVKLLKVC